MSFFVVCLLVFISKFVVSEPTVQIHTPDTWDYSPLPLTVIHARRQQWITFRLQAGSDPHIALQTYYNSMDVMYVIAIGGWTNSKSVIRRSEGGTILASFDGSVLDAAQFLPFWISWEASVIAVGRGSEVGIDLMMTWTDPSPLEVNYISIRTGSGYTGEWIIDLPSCEMELGFGSPQPDKIFSPDSRMLTEIRPSLTIHCCSSSCFSVGWCRSFSYNPAQQECRMFDSVPQAQDLIQETGWETWSMAS